MEKGYYWSSKDWANDQLRYAIKILNDRVMGYDCPDSGRIADALGIKQQLVDCHFPWQAKVLGHHIHQAQKRFRRSPKHVVVGLRRILRD